MSSITETKSADDLLFSHYLRIGERLTGEAAQAFERPEDAFSC
jgi:hypothetical protein